MMEYERVLADYVRTSASHDLFDNQVSSSFRLIALKLPDAGTSEHVFRWECSQVGTKKRTVSDEAE